MSKFWYYSPLFHHISWNFHAILIDLIVICVLSFIICHVLWSFEASFRQVKFVVLRFSKVLRENLIIFSQNLGAFRLFYHISWNFHTILIDLILSYVCFPLSFFTYYGPLRQVCVKLRSWLCPFWKFLAQIVCYFAKILVFFLLFNWVECKFSGVLVDFNVVCVISVTICHVLVRFQTCFEHVMSMMCDLWNLSQQIVCHFSHVWLFFKNTLCYIWCIFVDFDVWCA